MWKPDKDIALSLNQKENSIQGKIFSRNFFPEDGLGGLPKHYELSVFQVYTLQELIKVSDQKHHGQLDYLDQQVLLFREIQYYLNATGVSRVKMADGSGPGGGGGIPLHEFRREVPPGWAPGIPDYPLRLFFERLKLWCRIYEGDDTMVGPLVAGRLQGKAQRLGMQLRLRRPDGGTDVGSDALVRLSVEEVRDPANPALILQHAIPSGVQALCNSLREAFGMSDQDLVSKSIEDLMEFRRGKLTFPEYAIEWEIRMEEAVTRAGLEINDVGKFYLFFRGAGLPQKFVEDIKLQLQGDLRRFQEAKALALRLVNRSNDSDHFYQDDEAWEEGYLPEAEWDDVYWAEDDWSWMSDYQETYDDWYGEYEEDFEQGQWYGEDAEDEQWHSPEKEGEEAPGMDSGVPASSTATSTAQESFPMKGGKGKGFGCSICGSRWRSASSCPVNGGGKSGGKGRSSSKGYGSKGYGGGKGYGNKSFGGSGYKGKKGYGKSKSKGKRWAPRGWSSKGKGYYGFAEKTLTQSFGESKPQVSPPRNKTKTVHFRLDNDDEPVIHLGRHRAQEISAEDAEDPSTSSTTATTAKRLDFTFASAVYHESLSYHTVLGEKRRGLLVDPGAASGLIGSETLRDLISCLPPDQQGDISWNYEKSNNVSGINGTPETTLGMVNLPLSFSGAHGSFSADVLGGEGSLCPALLSNPALRRQQASILTDWFSNGDGCLVVRSSKLQENGHRKKDVDASEWCYLRLLLTDSGHYLLPVDDSRELSKETVSDVDGHMTLWASEIYKRWPDVRHCFLELPSRERERYLSQDASLASTSKEAAKSLEGTSCTTTAASTTSPDSEPETLCTTRTASITSPDSEPETICTTRTASVTSPDSEPETICTTRTASITSPDSEPETICTTSSGHLQIRHQATSVMSHKPFLNDQSTVPCDTWTIEGNYLVRHHRVPRRILFSPKCALDCPVSEARVLGSRITELKPVRQKASSRILEDDWEKSTNPNRDLGYLWTGRTRVRLCPERLEPLPTTMASTTSSPSVSMEPELFPNYDGDSFPDHWDDDRKEQSKRYYKAIPEEFYTKTGRRPITPRNVKSWMATAQGRGLCFQFWEWCSGSGRLSLLLLMANFIVGFPVDYRYGWDLAHPPHQRLLHECLTEFKPDMLFGAPSCGPWSVASSNKDPVKRLEDRNRELPTLEFLHDKMLWQHDQGRAFATEQPFGSDMFKSSPMARLLNHEGVRLQRLDQCMLGAQDETGRPVRKATGFLSNRLWRHIRKRCNGHKGRPHGVLQGRWNGCNRTALASVYPKRFCHAFGQDLWTLLRAAGATSRKTWPRSLFWLHELYYSCQRCQLGRGCPAHIEHTFVPGECRMGQPAIRASRESPSTPPATSTSPGPPSRLSVGDLEDPTGPFKMLARSGDYSVIALSLDATVNFAPEKRLYLKAALVQFIQSCIGVFSEATGADYDHWLDDPVLLRIFQDIFAPDLQVLGVLCSLRPWRRKVPDPYLSSSCAPIRQLIRGSLKSWHVQAPEDMRLMSHSQLHAAVEEADWHVHVFGYAPNAEQVDRAGRSPVERRKDGQVAPSSSAAPAPKPLAPSSSRTKPSASMERSPAPEDDIRPWNEDGAMEEEPDQAEEEEFKAVRPDEEEKALKPLFDFKKVYKRLQSDIVSKDPQMAKRLLLGLHERFYHCPIGDFKNMLLRAGLSSDILPLAEEAVMNCSICRKYVRMPNRPQVKIGSHAGSFNQRVQLDLFQYQEVWILLMVDEATRYKVATDVESREYGHLLSKMLDSWFVVFGPPHQLVLDQESSLMSHAAGRELERFSIERVPKGTTSGSAGKQHTGTGLVERHIGLVEITMLKLAAELDRQGLRLTPGELAKESAMSHNQSLNYNGATPSMAVFGILPRPFYQEDNNNITAVAGVLQTDITPFEKALRIRQLSLSMVQRAVAEDRIARAGRTRPHQLDTNTLVPGTSTIDFYREVQGDVGWRGPATLLRLDKDEGTAILTYQGRPYLVSLRRIRPHTPGVFLVMDSTQTTDFQWLQAMVVKLSPHKAVTVGWVPEISNHCISWRRASSSSLSYSDAWAKIVSLGKALSNHNVGGAILGQGVRVIHPPKGSSGVLLFWRQGQEGYGSQEHNDDTPLAMKKVTARDIDQLVFIYVFFYVNVAYEPSSKMKVIPSEGALDEAQPMEVDPSSRPSSPIRSSTDNSMDVDTEAVAPSSTSSAEKRKGPETRMVTLGPEAKKSKLENLVEYLYSEKVVNRTQHNLINLYWLMHRTQKVPLEFPSSWQSPDNHFAMAQWGIYMSRVFEKSKREFVTHNHLFVWPGKCQETVFADLL